MSSVGSTTQSIFSLSGLASNINTAQIIQQLMQINQVPQQQLKSQQTTYQTQLTAYQNLSSQMQAVGDAATALALPTGWQQFTASTSNATAVTATAGSGAVGGSVTMTVDQLASAAAVVSTSGVTSTSATVASSSQLLLSQASGLGFSSVSGTGLAAGAHTLTVNADGTVSLDGGTAVAPANGAVTLTSGLASGGSVTANLAGTTLKPGTVTLTSVSTGSGSLADVVSAINASGAGISAAAVQTTSGYQLQLSSTTTGAASAFTLDPNAFTAALGPMQALTAGRDASITVGDQAGKYTVTSATNSVTGVVPGVTLNLLQAGTGPVTVNVTKDASGLASQISSLIDSVNTVIQHANTYTAFDPNGTNTGPLLGDATVEKLSTSLQSAITDAVAGAGLQDASALGITVNTDGTLALDKTKLNAAIQANPQAVQDLFIQGTGPQGTGIAQRLEAAATAATDFTTGYLTSAASGAQAEVNSLQTQIDWWTPVLTEEQDALTQKFTQMETALAQLKSQGNAIGAALGQTSSSSTSSSSGTLSSTSGG